MSEVSFPDIIKRLMGGDYSTGTGYPSAREDIQTFVREIKRRIPELSRKDDTEVETLVLSSIEWAIKEVCKPIKTQVFVSEFTDAGVEIGVHQCHHPKIGDFYIVDYESWNADSGEYHTGFSLTRDKSKALEEFKKLVEVEKEYYTTD